MINTELLKMATNKAYCDGVRIAVKTIREQLPNHRLEDILEALEQTADSREEKTRNGTTN